jgi:ornithine decarboxylase
MKPPPLKSYFEAINEELEPIRERYPHIELLSEPGRALVAESTSLIVNVVLRKNNFLYINDGTYGSLFDAGTPQIIFPTRLLRDNADTTHLLPFSFYGPTCDTLDQMNGPFHLPGDIAAGDYIEIGQMGAYGRVFSTSFNGFRPEEGVSLIKDAPIMSLYHKRERVDETLETLA